MKSKKGNQKKKFKKKKQQKKLTGNLELGCFQASSQSIPNVNLQHPAKKGGGVKYQFGQGNNKTLSSSEARRSNKTTRSRKVLGRVGEQQNMEEWQHTMQ